MLAKLLEEMEKTVIKSGGCGDLKRILNTYGEALYCAEYDDCDECKADSLKVIAKLKKQVSEQSKESGWIPCDERLPEDSYEVLMCVELSPNVTCVTVGICMYYDNDDKPQEWITTTGEKLEKAYEDFIGTHQTAYSQPRVTAWQPLPQPYVKGDTNE